VYRAAQVLVSRGNRFAYSSTLALYVHDDDDYSLNAITATQSATIVAFDWRVNSGYQNVFLVCTNDDVVRLYRDGVETHATRFPSFGCRHVSWDQHDDLSFVLAAGKEIGRAHV
jgi:hypothetical protein